MRWMSNVLVKRSTVRVPWRYGLHMRPAARLARIAQKFRSTISLNFRGNVANVQSVLSVLALCATMGVALDVEAVGEDEQCAIAAVESEFLTAISDGDDGDASEAQDQARPENEAGHR